MEESHHERSTYVLTTDLAQLMEAYLERGLQISPPDFYQRVDEHLIGKLKECLPPCDIEVINLNKLMTQMSIILSQVMDSTREAQIISPIPSIAAKYQGYCIQINRITDPNGNLMEKNGLEVGARPGFPLLDSQFGAMEHFLEGRPVIVVDEGIFEGLTMGTIIGQCNAAGIEVDHVVSGITFPRGGQFVTQLLGYKDTLHSWKEGHFLDWLPDHDFFPFVPNCGRIVGLNYNSQSMPIYLHNGLSLCKPYILPYGRPNEWANIRKDKQKDFSVFCFKETISMFEELESINNTKLTLSCVIHTLPRVSLPVRHGTREEFPSLTTRIIDILYHDLRVAEAQN